jgi:cyanate permease
MQRTETAWAAVFAATLCGIAVAMNIGKVPIALPQLREQFDLSLVAAGWMVATFNTIAVLSGVFIGIWVDRVGALRFCFTGLAASALGGILGLAGTDANALLLSRVLEGFGFIAIAASAPTLISAATAPAQRRLSLSMWSSFMPAGASLCILLAPPILASAGWRGLWWLVLGVIAAAVLALASQRRIYASSAAQPHEGMADVKQALHQTAPWLLTLAFSCYSLQFFAMANWLPTFLKEQRDLSSLSIALLSALVIAVNVPGNLLGGMLLQRHMNRGRLIAAASLTMGLCSIGIFSDALPDVARYGLCLMLTFGGGVIPAVVLSSPAVLAANPQQIGTLQGLFLQGANFGQFLGMPLIAGVVAANGHWSAALAVTGPAAAIATAVGLVLGRRRL